MSDIVRYCQILSDIVRYYQIRYCQTFKLIDVNQMKSVKRSICGEISKNVKLRIYKMVCGSIFKEKS